MRPAGRLRGTEAMARAKLPKVKPWKPPTVALEVHYPAAGWVWQGSYASRAEAESAVAELVRCHALADREHRVRALDSSNSNG